MRGSILIALLVLALPCLARSAHFKGRCDDSVLPGSERWPELQRRFAELQSLIAQDELARAIEVQREIARLQCHNHFQLYYLAELLVQTGDYAGAIAVLEELYDLEVNDMEQRLFNTGNALHPVVESPAFAGSRLATRIAERSAIVEARKARSGAQLAAMAPSERPPGRYIAEDACPFECCVYRRWSVLEDTMLVAAPGSGAAIATARAGRHVEGLTGEVHLVPLPVAVVHAEPAYDPNAEVTPGEILFLLDGLGEGMRRVWHRGVVRTMSTSGEVQEACPFPDHECWGELLVPEEAPEESESVWWMRVRLPDGTEGWTREQHFGDMDGCA